MIAKASSLSQWIEEQTTNFENREFNSASVSEVTQLLEALETFRGSEKPEKLPLLTF